jgi:hypothetical protein
MAARAATVLNRISVLLREQDQDTRTETSTNTGNVAGDYPEDDGRHWKTYIKHLEVLGVVKEDGGLEQVLVERIRSRSYARIALRPAPGSDVNMRA